MPCRIMYMVTVRLISSTDFPNIIDNVGIAGKYMFAVRGLSGRYNMSRAGTSYW